MPSHFAELNASCLCPLLKGSSTTRRMHSFWIRSSLKPTNKQMSSNSLRHPLNILLLQVFLLNVSTHVLNCGAHLLIRALAHQMIFSPHALASGPVSSPHSWRAQQDPNRIHMQALMACSLLALSWAMWWATCTLKMWKLAETSSNNSSTTIAI